MKQTNRRVSLHGIIAAGAVMGFALGGAGSASAADSGFYLGGYLRTGESKEGSLAAPIQDRYAGQELFDTFAVDFTVGYRFDFGLRAEADFFELQCKNPQELASFNLGSGTLRALYDIPVHDLIVPYAGVGLNTFNWSERKEGSPPKKADSRFNIACSLVAGVSVNVIEKVMVDLQYSRLLVSTYYTNAGRYDDGANEIRLGARYHF
jgi:opacity protein-like surface antigen